MAELSLTLRLPFYRLNALKVQEFERLTELNTLVANNLLEMEKAERKKLTSAAFGHIEIGSAWINQTIRNANAKTKVKKFKRMWLETNNQNFEISKQGDFYGVAFNLFRGKKGRIPLTIHQASHTEVLALNRENPRALRDGGSVGMNHGQELHHQSEILVAEHIALTAPQ